MLDKNALSQLQGLKDKIEAEKEIAEGTVKATRSRFGFVMLNDNREIFLPPDEMQRKPHSTKESEDPTCCGLPDLCSCC